MHTPHHAESREACVSVHCVDGRVSRSLPLHLPLRSCLEHVYRCKCGVTSIQLLMSRDACGMWDMWFTKFPAGFGVPLKPPLVSSQPFLSVPHPYSEGAVLCTRWERPALHLLLCFIKAIYNFLETAVLRYNSHTVKFTHYRSTVHWILVYPQSWKPSPL